MDIMVCSYAYLLHRKGREKLLNYFDNELDSNYPPNENRKTLVIFDEGHNLFEEAING